MNVEAGASLLNRTRALYVLLGVFGAAMALAWMAPSSEAASKRVFEEIFGGAAQPTFVRAQGIAVDHDSVSGDLYVIDVGAGAKTISRWHADGTPSPFSALGSNVIDAKKGPGEKPCAEEPASCDWNGRGAGLGSGFTFATNATSRKLVEVALDESDAATDGNIYITQREAGLVDMFAADGTYLAPLTEFNEGAGANGPKSNLGAPCGVSVDDAGALYVGDQTQNLIHKYVAQGAPHSPLTVTDNVANGDALNQPCMMAAGRGLSDGYLFVTANTRNLYKLKTSTLEVVESLVETVVTSQGSETAVSVSPESGNVFFGRGFNTIVEVDASGAEPIEISTATPASLVMGFAPAAAGGRLHVARESASKLDVFGPPLPLPIVSVEPASEVAETGADLLGSVDRQGLASEGCSFEYIADAVYRANKDAKVDAFTGASSQACDESDAEIDAGPEPFAVHTSLIGLAAGELFHYRLSETTLAGAVTSAERTFATIVPPEIEDDRATAITDTEATIKVLINPKFYPTSFHIEYGSGGSIGLKSPTTEVGSDGVAHPLTVPLSGLVPGTTYSWRVVASRTNGLDAESPAPPATHTFTTYRPFAPDTECSNQALRGGASALLPDCRAYEMVSPVDKNGGDIVNSGNGTNLHDAYIQAAPEGDKIAYSASPAFADQLSSRYYNQYIAGRDAGGWENSGVNAPLGKQLGGPAGVIHFEREVSGFTDDLCSMWFEDYNATPLNPDGQAGLNNLYRRHNCAPGIGGFETTTIGAPLAAGTPANYVDRYSVQGFSDDGNATFFAANAQLATIPLGPEAAASSESQVYLRLAGDPYLRLVSVLPGGLAATKAVLGGGTVGNLQNAVSKDGTRAFWTHSVASSGVGKLYLRLNPGGPAPSTVEVSEGTGASFWDATPNGSDALYTEGSLGSGAASLYTFNVGAVSPRTKLAEKVYGVAGASDDLSRIFLISGVDHDGTGPATENQRNLYLLENDGLAPEDGDFTLVTTLPDAEGVASLGTFSRSSRVAPDGRHIVFQSRASLTGFDNTDAGTGEAAVEVFTYSVDEGLHCVSCNPAGVQPQGRELPSAYYYPWTGGGAGFPAAAWIPTWEHPLHASRVLSADGNRIFFHSFDRLLPRDTNGTVQDLYQWEAAGAGRCDPGDADYFAANGGCLSLISSGESSWESEFFDADEDGSDVFFTTASSLVSQDPGSIDLYDARVNGGYPPPEEPTICEGEACQNPSSAPDVETPASGTYDGPRDLTQSASCRSAARRTTKLSGQAKHLRRRAKRAGNPGVAKRLRQTARLRGAQAKRESLAVKRCQRANRRAGR